MYLLDFLDGKIQADRQVEYRLLCSGLLYPEVLGDWTKSDGARMLLVGPVELLNASQPADDYPQELALRFDIGLVAEREGNCSRSFPPDDEIARDTAALLTLLCRRLVTVACETRERYWDEQSPEPLRDFPLPFCANLRPAFWTPRAADVAYGLHGVEVRFNQPSHVKFERDWVESVIASLPRLEHAEAILRAARLYASALERVETMYEASYQMLISAVEAVANAALEKWQPDSAEQIASKSKLLEVAKREGLSDEAAKEVVLEAQRDNPWSRRKFVKFLVDNCDQASLDEDDDLFLVPEFIRPPKGAFEKAIKMVYSVRSGATHGGHAYPATANVGTSSWLPTDAAYEAFSQVTQGRIPFPPVTWFERVVHSAIVTFLRNEVEAQQRPGGK